VSIVSRGVEEIEYTISRVPAGPDQPSGKVKPRVNFRIRSFLNDSFDETNIARIVREKETIAAPGPFQAELLDV